MKLLLGPLLYSVPENAADAWSFRVHVYVAGPPNVSALSLKTEPASTILPPALVADFSSLPEVGGSLWAWKVTVPRKSEQQSLKYTIEGLDQPIDVDGVKIPATGELPRFAFFSCNGVSDEKYWRHLESPYACWKDLRAQHDGQGLHLLIGGGDQLYCDSLFESNFYLREDFKHWSRHDKVNRPVPSTFAQQMRVEYIRLYLQRWGQQSGIGHGLARIPGLFTWDDHDIFDGWGSLGELQKSPHYIAMYQAARETFAAFQLGMTPPQAGHFFQRADFQGAETDLTVLMLDSRSDRTMSTILSDQQWAHLDQTLVNIAASRAAPARKLHVVVVSSVPVVNMAFGSGTEAAAGILGLKDDLIDQWESGHHRGERARLLMTLLDAVPDARCAVTVLAGDIHVGSRARIRSRNPRQMLSGKETVIEQVTSSAILHPAPSGVEFWAMRSLSGKSPDDFSPLVATESVHVAGDMYLRERNWLLGSFDAVGSKGRLWLQFRAESGPVALQTCVEAP